MRKEHAYCAIINIINIKNYKSFEMFYIFLIIAPLSNHTTQKNKGHVQAGLMRDFRFIVIRLQSLLMQQLQVQVLYHIYRFTFLQTDLMTHLYTDQTIKEMCNISQHSIPLQKQSAETIYFVGTAADVHAFIMFQFYNPNSAEITVKIS